MKAFTVREFLKMPDSLTHLVLIFKELNLQEEEWKVMD
jgi:hypothetical protein